jgi:putative restriction endonuclease
VFMHRVDSIYDDRPEEQYQFPSRYLSRASQCIGDWIVYLEPVKAGKKGYHAIARVEKVIPDPTKPKHYLAIIETGSYLPFEKYVSFNDSDGWVERGLVNENNKISGRAQAALRPISVADFNRILSKAFSEEKQVLPRSDISPHQISETILAEEHAEFIFETDRARVATITSRAVRDRVFRRLVIEAYDRRCAVTGLQLINGGGRAEVEAAHIRPVQAGGPDLISNGLALSGTAHWMFDRGLICLSDTLEIQVSRQVNDPDSIWALVNKTGKAIVPDILAHQPHPRFLEWHRQNCFKH